MNEELKYHIRHVGVADTYSLRCQSHTPVCRVEICEVSSDNPLSLLTYGPMKSCHLKSLHSLNF